MKKENKENIETDINSTPTEIDSIHEVTPKCGIVMPISPIDGCSAEHWSDVLSILRDVIRDANFFPNLVSDADEIGIIQRRIIQNLYSNEIVICDVSCKNPNVMFELGIRLAFDKPTIIIKDDITDYTFDTSIIEHLTYPRDLRFNKMILFKENLKNKITATYKKSKEDVGYTTFLKNFGEFKVAQLQESEISPDKFIQTLFLELKDEIYQLRRSQNRILNENLIKTESNNIQPAAYNSLIDKIISQYMTEKNINYRGDILNDEKKFSDLFSFTINKLITSRLKFDHIDVEKAIIKSLEVPF